MQVEPQKEHKWLQNLVGDWTFECECITGPDMAPSKFTGTDSVRSLGGVWMLCEGKGEMPGGGYGINLMTLGYDPAKKRFVGSFIGSMFTNLWIYEGKLDAAEKVLTLDCEGPAFTPDGKPAEGKTAKYQDIIEFISNDHRTLTSQSLGEDGKWTTFMTAHYRRSK
jgi:hypothetical protein